MERLRCETPKATSLIADDRLPPPVGTYLLMAVATAVLPRDTGVPDRTPDHARETSRGPDRITEGQ